MKEALLFNIKKSFQIISERKLAVDKSIIHVVQIESCKGPFRDMLESIESNALKPIPWFFNNDKGDLRSPQESFFGFYAVRNTIRGIMIGYRFFQAGEVLKENNFLAASVVSYYTAAFHLLNSFLALNGRVLIDNVMGPPKIIKRRYSTESTHRELKNHPQLIIAILTRNNLWKYEPRRRSHSVLWQELLPILIELKERVPEFFMAFFKCILSGWSFSKYSKEDLINEALRRLTQVRHTAIYEGYGYDDGAHDQLINEGYITGTGLDNRTNAYKQFALGLLKLTTEDIINLKDMIPRKYIEKTRNRLAVSVIVPPFENGDLSPSVDDEIKNRMEDIYQWLFPN